MTREKAKYYLIDKDIKTHGKHKIAHHITILTFVNELIDNIYDDFESRTCKNCKYNYECSIQDSLLQTAKQNKLDIYNLDSFGCNKFEKGK